MNNLSFTFAFLDFRGTILETPPKAIACTSAALNATVLLAGLYYALYKRSKNDPLLTYIFISLAGLFGIIGGALYSSHAVPYAKGYWIVSKAYYSFVWLSCIYNFLSLAEVSPDNTGRNSGSLNIVRILVYLAYVWSFVTIVCGIVIAAKNFDPFDVYYSDGFKRIIQFARLVNFHYYSNWGFAAIFIILCFIVFSFNRRAPNTPTKSIALFGLFSMVAVITDTIVIHVVSADTLNGVIAILAVVFIFTDVFSVCALYTSLIFAKRWHDFSASS